MVKWVRSDNTNRLIKNKSVRNPTITINEIPNNDISNLKDLQRIIEMGKPIPPRYEWFKIIDKDTYRLKKQGWCVAY